LFGSRRVRRATSVRQRLSVLSLALPVMLVPTVARAATTSTLWVRRYDNGGVDRAFSIAVSPDGTKVFVTGSSERPTTGKDCVTLAYNVTTGHALWSRRYDGPGHAKDSCRSLAVAPSGRRVFVAGGSAGSGGDLDFVTIAYSATSGNVRWVRRYGPPTRQGTDVAMRSR
jgi:DNA-binding beta-propeller fold protein YncE